MTSDYRYNHEETGERPTQWDTELGRKYQHILWQLDMYHRTKRKAKPTEIHCEECGNMRYIAYVHWQDGLPYLMHKPCRCWEERNHMQRLINSGLEPLSTKTFDNFFVQAPYQQQMKQKAMEFLESYQWFFIGGQSGAGKTHLCSAIANTMRITYRRVAYMKWNEDVRTLKTLVMEGEAYEKAMKRYSTEDVLYIDDLFKTKQGAEVSDAELRIAFELINYRYVNHMQTIISSEKTLNEIIAIDEAIGGRIAEKTKEFAINIQQDPNKNYRLEVHKP